jgi:hypothetical protein
MSEITFSGMTGRAAREGIGERCVLVLDPERRAVYPFTTIGSGWPTNVFHGRAIALNVPAAADLASVEQVLRSRDGALAELLDAYVGTRWDGCNHVGVWSGEFDARREREEALEEALKDAARVWPASDWLRPVWADVVREARQRLDAGESREGALAAMVDAEAADATENGVLLDVRELAEAIGRAIAEAAEAIREESEDAS